MKDLIAALLLLSALTAWFSFYGENVPLERTQKEGWAFFGGTSGEPIPSEGADGQMDAFVTNAEAPQETQAKMEQNTVKAQPKPPITITVVYPDMEHAEEYRQAMRETFWIGVAAGVLFAEILVAAFLAVLYWLDHKGQGKTTNKTQRRQQHDKQTETVHAGIPGLLQPRKQRQGKQRRRRDWPQNKRGNP